MMKKDKRKKKRKMRKQGALGRLWAGCCSPSLAGHFNDQTCPILGENLREHSTRQEEHSYGVKFCFQRLDC